MQREMNRADETRTRTRAYELLALSLSPPSAELAEAVSDPEAPIKLPVLDPTALSPEHYRLFVGPGPLPAPPYESVYREGWRVMGETTLDVRRQYAEAGYVLDPSLKELPDRASAELAFMALLSEEEAKAWEDEDVSTALGWLERERTFLNDHLTQWIPAFCDRLLASTHAAFYRSVAVALREIIALDAERVKALAGLLEEASP